MVKVLLVGRDAGLAPQPRNIVVKELKVASMFPAGVMQEAIVQDDLVEAHTITLRIHMQFANGLGLITSPTELSGQRDGMDVVELHPFLVTHTTVPLLGLSSK